MQHECVFVFVHAGRFSHFSGVAENVQHVVSGLERKPQRLRVAVCRIELLLRAARGNHAELAGCGNERAGFEPVDIVNFFFRQNQLLASGTNPDAIRSITDMVDALCLGYKLPGAGGGGYLYMVAKDPEAAVRIKQILSANITTPNARFVEMTLSRKGLQISRS